jgi:uncharacterized Ntn-hydrolase superfamily protein
MIGENFPLQGNMFRNQQTVDALRETFTDTARLDLSEWLVRALEAAQLARGEKRGRQCSAPVVVTVDEHQHWDLRVDERPDPVAEPFMIYDIARLGLLPLVAGLPIRTEPRGSGSAKFATRDMLRPPLRSGWRSRHNDRPRN